MPLEREKQGLELEEYRSKLEDGTYALRIGKEVPEGDVNLAYIHTPQMQSDENISLIDTSYTSDNVIPQDQLQSMVVANGQGELEYVDMIGDDEVRIRPPRNTFPSKKVNITRKFKKNDMRTENALYYKFEMDYHYDSKIAVPNEAGEYVSEKYTGQQIELTDENGNLLDDTYKYDIYVQAHAFNPRIYSVRIYLHKNTDDVETIKVRYNHVDAIVKDEHLLSVQRQIEFYTNSDNTIVVDNQGKQMLEGGKLRIVNGISAYEERTEAQVAEAGSEEEVFAIVPKENGEGYRIVVPQKSEPDPRVPRIFSHRVVAQYTGTDDQTVKVTVGHITDWCINPEALLQSERMDYTGPWKNLGIPVGGGKLNSKQMIELSLPFGTPSIPSDADFFIEDDNGNLLYHITSLTDNPNVETQVNDVLNTAEAKANQLNQAPWKNAMHENTVLKSNPIPHRCTIIPEVQKTKWDFAWKANGQGYTERRTNYKASWQICANIGFRKTINPNILDVLDKTKWETLGNEADVNKWKYSYVQEMGKNVVEYLDNANDVIGFYQKKEVIGGTLTDLMGKSDYQFSTKVRLTDPVDDDAIGILFRVRNAHNYYMFIWEKDEISTVNKPYTYDHGEGIAGVVQGCGRIRLDEYGYATQHYHPGGAAVESWRWTNDVNKYKNQMGFGTKHKRIFKATPTTKAVNPDPGPNSNTWDGSTRYPMDLTGCSFEDITSSAGYNAKGWEYNKDYKITVVVTGSLFRIYINDNVNSSELGQLVCQGTDNTHTTGTYGIFCASQRWTYWYDMEMTEIEMDTVCTEEKEVVLTDNTEKKLSNYTVTDMMAPLIEQRAQESFRGAPYEIFGYIPQSDGDLTLRIDARTDFLYGKTSNAAAGGVTRTPWTTDDNGLTVQGTGQVEYHPDGHFTIHTMPSALPTDQIPSDVLGFSWNQPIVTSGSNVSMSLNPPSELVVTATVPPIRLIGRPYVLEEDMLLKSDGIKHLENLFGEDGFYEQLEIPEDTPKEDILLRIERGKVTGIAPNGVATTENPEYRVNYRLRCQKEGFTRMPVDQFQNQLGVNRLRLKSIMKDGAFDSTIAVDVVAWTPFQDLEAVPLFAIKVDEERKIEIEKPKLEQRHMELDNWYLRVKNGRFLKRLILPYFEPSSEEKTPEVYVSYPELLGMVEKPEDVVEVDLEYTLDANDQYKLEYRNQEFHQRPYVLVDKESPIILNEYAIQTRYAPIVLESLTKVSYLEVYSLRASQRRALRVSDIDAAKGIIYLHDRIWEQDEVYVRYAYQEDWFTYRGFHRGTDFFHLDLNPTQGHRHTIAANGIHQWIPIDRDTETYELKEAWSKELLVKQVHIYLRPSVIRYVDSENPLRHGKPIPGTMKKNVLYHTDEEWWFNPKDYKYDPTMLRLGKVMLQANSEMHENMTILDTRTRGGGLDESLSKDIIKQVNQESMYHWDIGYFDGEAYQENGVIVVRMPRSILKSEQNPNGFHESQVQAAVAKHKGYGILPIIEYYEEVKDENKFNIIPNPEFLYEQHIGYYDPVRSQGEYEIRQMKLGSGDNYVLQVSDDAEYGITIPGHQFKSNQYRLDIKALKEQAAPNRSAGTVDIHYKNGEVIRTQLASINNSQWMVYKQLIEVSADVHHVTITLNKTTEARTGRILYDYVMLHPSPKISEEGIEIHEI